MHVSLLHLKKILLSVRSDCQSNQLYDKLCEKEVHFSIILKSNIFRHLIAGYLQLN